MGRALDRRRDAYLREWWGVGMQGAGERGGYMDVGAGGSADADGDPGGEWWRWGAELSI